MHQLGFWQTCREERKGWEAHRLQRYSRVARRRSAASIFSILARYQSTA